MGYANSKHSHKGIEVEPDMDGRTIRISDYEYACSMWVRDKAQAQRLIDLIRDASVKNGWGSIK